MGKTVTEKLLAAHLVEGSLQKGEEMHKILTGSRFEILDNAGHVPNYECAEEFNKLSLDFLRQ